MVYEMESTMIRQSMFVILGLMAAVTLGCEKKQEAPAAPTTEETSDAMDGMKEEVKEAADEAADKAKETAEDVKDAVDNAAAPQ